MNRKQNATPCTCFSHDEKEGRLTAQVELPGVDKADISLDMRRNSFCVSAKRGDSDTEYSGCFTLSHDVEPEKAEAQFENGLLRVFAPIRDWESKYHVPIQ